MEKTLSIYRAGFWSALASLASSLVAAYPDPILVCGYMAVSCAVGLRQPVIGYLFFLTFIAFSPDNVSLHNDISSAANPKVPAGLFFYHAGPIGYFELFLAAYLTAVGLGAILRKQRFRLIFADVFLFLIAYLLFSKLLVGYFRNSIDRLFFSDLVPEFTLAISYLVIRLSLNDIKQTKNATAGTLMVVAILNLIQFVSFSYSSVNDAPQLIQPITDSYRNVSLILVFYGMASLLSRASMTSNHPFFLDVAFLILGLIGTLIYSSRGNYFFLCIGIAIILLAHFKSRGRSRLLIRFGLFSIIVFGIFSFLNYLNPDLGRYAAFKIRSAVDVYSGGYVSSFGVRYFSLLNILAEGWEHATLLFGTGAGGFFTDRFYPFTSDLLPSAAFPDDWIASGQLFKPHGAVLVLLLKVGIIGLIIYLGGLLRIWVFYFSSVRGIINRQSAFVVNASMALLCVMPMLAYKAFTPKLQLLLAVVIALTGLLRTAALRTHDTGILTSHATSQAREGR